MLSWNNCAPATAQQATAGVGLRTTSLRSQAHVCLVAPPAGTTGSVPRVAGPGECRGRGVCLVRVGLGWVGWMWKGGWPTTQMLASPAQQTFTVGMHFPHLPSLVNQNVTEAARAPGPGPFSQQCCGRERRRRGGPSARPSTPQHMPACICSTPSSRGTLSSLG